MCQLHMKRVCKLNVGMMRTGRKPPKMTTSATSEAEIQNDEMNIVDNILELEAE